MCKISANHLKPVRFWLVVFLQVMTTLNCDLSFIPNPVVFTKLISWNAGLLKTFSKTPFHRSQQHPLGNPIDLLQNETQKCTTSNIDFIIHRCTESYFIITFNQFIISICVEKQKSFQCHLQISFIFPTLPPFFTLMEGIITELDSWKSFTI